MLLVKCPFGRNFRTDASVSLIFSKANFSFFPPKWTVNELDSQILCLGQSQARYRQPIRSQEQHINLRRSQRILRVFKCQFQKCRLRLQNAEYVVFVRESHAQFVVIMHS